MIWKWTLLSKINIKNNVVNQKPLFGNSLRSKNQPKRIITLMTGLK